MIERNPRALDCVSLVLELPGKMSATKKPVSGCGTAKNARTMVKDIIRRSFTEEPEVLLKELKEAIEG